MARFADKQLCVDSAQKYISTATLPNPDRFNAWMLRAHDKDQLVARVSRLNTDPDVSPRPSGFQLNGCSHCHGKRYVRRDLTVDHAEFGKTFPCPVCSSRAADPATHCPDCEDFASVVQDHEHPWCDDCGCLQTQDLDVVCRNADWHHPDPAAPVPDDGPFLRIYRKRIAAGDTPEAQRIAQREAQAVLGKLGDQWRAAATAPPRGYELARAQGFEGTLKEWAAIVTHSAEPASPPVQETLPDA